MTPMIGRLSPRSRRALIAVFALATIAGAALVALAAPGAPVNRSRGVAAFETVRAVLQHPRCQNCHIPGDAPLQFDDGRVHALGVRRGVDGKGAFGLPCATCHAAANPPASYGPHMPPGAPNWNLPPPDRKMVFIGLKSGELCRRLKDPRLNGGKDMKALIEHVSRDKLVLWGWSPGVGRRPVSVPHAEFVARFKEWAAAGAPCAP
ncbi:MAG TPA: hypothetical protein VK698_32615 [Kofleriaceae bacterium]|nr:hypothetical protein [Kofleriaceae bacterium]